jgi:myo-inositol-1(or 4)-monophosphatase
MSAEAGIQPADALDAELLDVAVDAAHAAGKILVGRFAGPAEGVRQKADPMDLASEADLAAEGLIASRIAERRPDDALLGEETGFRGRAGSAISWVVDPLDGTQNFLRGLPMWCVSIAAEDASGPRVGVIHDPLHEETFVAVRGAGAWLGSEALPAPNPSLQLGEMILTGSHRRAVEAGAERGERLSRFAACFGSSRELVAAALELAWTAAARVDALYHESKIKVWDKSAGLLICSESGLAVHDLEPAPDGGRPRVLVCPPHLSAELLALVG